jgi:hypothetical protein
MEERALVGVRGMAGGVGAEDVELGANDMSVMPPARAEVMMAGRRERRELWWMSTRKRRRRERAGQREAELHGELRRGGWHKRYSAWRMGTSKEEAVGKGQLGGEASEWWGARATAESVCAARVRERPILRHGQEEGGHDRRGARPSGR